MGCFNVLTGRHNTRILINVNRILVEATKIARRGFTTLVGVTTYGGMTAFHEKLKALMKQHRYSQTDVAKSVDVSQSLVSLWTKGKSLPSLDDAAKLAKFLGVGLDYLADDTQDDPAPPEFAEWERGIVELMRMMGLDRKEATRRLTTSPNQGQPPKYLEGGPFPAAGPEYPNESPQGGRGTPRKKQPG